MTGSAPAPSVRATASWSSNEAAISLSVLTKACWKGVSEPAAKSSITAKGLAAPMSTGGPSLTGARTPGDNPASGGLGSGLAQPLEQALGHRPRRGYRHHASSCLTSCHDRHHRPYELARS